jgi:ABC-type Fe3+/spermidine/putrescine transport system ATPase subunit
VSDLFISRLTKTYKQSKESGGFTIHSFSLNIRQGECFAILGPSGCGKTTLLKLIAGLLPPDEGTITLGEKVITSIPAEQRGFGMVFQQPLLFPHMTVIENVAFGLKMQGLGKKARLESAQEVIAAVGLNGYDHRYPSQLSGGQQQRVALARAIVTRPRLLLLDEPFTALDPGIRGEMRRLVKKIHQEFRITMLFVTHDRDEAFELADRIAIMHEGQILQTGSPMEVYTKPDHPIVARFIGSANVIEGEFRQGEFHSGDFRVEVQPIGISAGPGWLVIRPELCHLVANKEEGHISGVVTKLRLRQGFYQVKVDTGDVLIEVVEKMHNVNIPQVGDQVSFALDAHQIHFIPKDGLVYGSV